MAIKLKSVFQNPQLQLGLKSVVYGALLLFTHPIIFIVGAVLLYARPLFRTFEMLGSLALLLGVSIILTNTAVSEPYFFLSGVYASILFYLILGVKDLVFVHRAGWHRVLNLGLVYAIFLLFFYHSQDFFLVKILLVFFAILLLLRELFKKRLTYWLLSLLMIEAVWAISLLPIGFINFANISALTYFILTDLAIHHANNNLTRRRILIDATLFILLFLAILAFSRWSL